MDAGDVLVKSEADLLSNKVDEALRYPALR